MKSLLEEGSIGVDMPPLPDDVWQGVGLLLLTDQPAFSGTFSETETTWSIPVNEPTTTAAEPRNGTIRWYDPVTGRWLSKDPIGISGGLNQYVFADNNPVNFRDPLGLCAEGGDNRHIIPYVDLGLQGMLPIIGGGGPWGSVGITGYLDPLADPWYDFLGIGLHWGAGGGIGGELDAGLAVGGMYGESIHSAEGLGGTAGGSGAALHGVSGNVGWSDDFRTWSVDLGYSPGAAAEIHGGRVGYGVVTSGDVVDGVIQTGRDAASAVRETTRPLRSTRGQMWFIWRMTHP